MNDEIVLRQEAKKYYLLNIDVEDSENAINTIRELKFYLKDIYSSEDKAIFIDEIESNLLLDLNNHINNRHKGLPMDNCMHEEYANALRYYLRQELNALPAIIHENKAKDKHNRNSVFISYCHSDKDYLSDIQRHFKPFLKHIEIWDDSKITPGQKWKDEIKNAIDKAKVAIFLVSTDFLGSDFIAAEEIPPFLEKAKEDGATILNVIIKPCLFDEFPDLNQFQAMNTPSRPVSMMDENERETFYTNLVKQVKKQISE